MSNTAHKPISNCFSPLPAGAVSVVIPAYNAARYIRETIASAVANEIVHRVIVVDDGSTDETSIILRALQADLPNLEVVTQRNQGLSAARNAGFRIVATPFTCFVDADDRLLPGGLAELHRKLMEDPTAAGAYGQVDYIDERSNRLNFKRAQAPVRAIRLEDVLQANFIDTIGAMLFRTAAVTSAGLFDVSLPFAEDWEFYTRLVLLGPILPLDQRVMEYRQHSTSMMHAAQLDLNTFEAALSKVFSPIGPGIGRIDPETLKRFEARKRAGILRRLGHRRQSAATHLRILAILLQLLAASRYDRTVLNLLARAVLTSGKRIILRV